MKLADVRATERVRDADLRKRIADAQGLGIDFEVRRCVAEQERRDNLLLLPRDARRRAETKYALEEQGGTDRDSLRHIHSALAICSLPYTRQALEVREWERNQCRMSLMVQAGKLRSPENGKWVDQPLPYGSRARLLMMHTCSEAIRQKKPEIEIEDSLTGFIKAMGFPKKAQAALKGFLCAMNRMRERVPAANRRWHIGRRAEADQIWASFGYTGPRYHFTFKLPEMMSALWSASPRKLTLPSRLLRSIGASSKKMCV
jgi:hypothetical protein